PVALVAAFVSYRHLSGLLAHYGEEPLAAWTGPLAVDGLMVVATGALIATGRHHTTTPVSEPAARPAAAVSPAPTVQVPALGTHTVPAPTAGPVRPEPSPSHVDGDPTEPSTATQPVRERVAATVVPTPAQVADRLTANRPAHSPTDRLAAPARPAPSPRRPR